LWVALNQTPETPAAQSTPRGEPVRSQLRVLRWVEKQVGQTHTVATGSDHDSLDAQDRCVAEKSIHPEKTQRTGPRRNLWQGREMLARRLEKAQRRLTVSRRLVAAVLQGRHEVVEETLQENQPWVCGSGGMTGMIVDGWLGTLLIQCVLWAVHGLRLLCRLRRWYPSHLLEHMTRSLWPEMDLRAGNEALPRHRRMWIRMNRNLVIWRMSLHKTMNNRKAEEEFYLRLVTMLAGSPPYDSNSCTMSTATVLSEYFFNT